MEPNKSGKYSVGINVEPEKLGDYSVVINPDLQGNIIMNNGDSVALWYKARAGNGAIAIGAFASAGSNNQLDELNYLINQLTKCISSQNDIIKQEFEKLKYELNNPTPNKDKISKILGSLKNFNIIGDFSIHLSKLIILLNSLL